MRVTIEIEPEEAAKFFKSLVPESVQTVVNNTTDWNEWVNSSNKVYGPGLMPFWNEAASKWLDDIRGNNKDTDK